LGRWFSEASCKLAADADVVSAGMSGTKVRPWREKNLLLILILAHCFQPIPSGAL
jgi:hypothetical protein